MSKKHSKTNRSSSNELVTDFGTRAINTQNFSKTVVLPKTALSNCGDSSTDKVKIQLVQNNGERFLKLTPVRTPKEASS